MKGYDVMVMGKLTAISIKTGQLNAAVFLDLPIIWDRFYICWSITKPQDDLQQQVWGML